MRIANRNSYLLLALVIFSLLAYVVLRTGPTPLKLLILLFAGLLLALPLRIVARPSTGVILDNGGIPTFVEFYSRF
jgi:hypothetical protein